jgi:predicted DNA-binding protein
MSTLLKSVLSEKEPKTGTMITLRMPDDLLQRLNAVCNDRRVHKPRARIIKAMIEAGLKEMEAALGSLDAIEESNRGVDLLRQDMKRAAVESNGWIKEVQND